jgi:hypothetical protein
MVVGSMVRNNPGQPKKRPMPMDRGSEEDINFWYTPNKVTRDNVAETQILILTVLFCLSDIKSNPISPGPIISKLLPLPPITPAANNPSNKYDPKPVNFP